MPREMRGSGGTEGGLGMFLFGIALCVAALYFFLDSVQVTTGGVGWVGGALRRSMGGGGSTTSMGLIFVPFFLGVVLLFYNSKMMVGWVLMIIGLAIIIVEILSRIVFRMNMKTTHLLLLFIMMAAGLGMILKSFKDTNRLIGD